MVHEDNCIVVEAVGHRRDRYHLLSSLRGPTARANIKSRKASRSTAPWLVVLHELETEYKIRIHAEYPTKRDM